MIAMIPYGLETVFLILLALISVIGIIWILVWLFSYDTADFHWNDPFDVIALATLLVISLGCIVAFFPLLSFQLDRDVANNLQLGKDAMGKLEKVLIFEQNHYENTGTYAPDPPEELDDFHISNNLKLITMKEEARSKDERPVPFQVVLANGTFVASCDDHDGDDVGCPEDEEWKPQNVPQNVEPESASSSR